MPLKAAPKVLKILPYRNLLFFLSASLYLHCFRNIHLPNTMQCNCKELYRFWSNINSPPASCEAGEQRICTDLLLPFLCLAMFTCAPTALSKRNLILTFMAVLTWHQNLLLRQFAGGWGCHADTSRAWSDSRQGLQKKRKKKNHLRFEWAQLGGENSSAFKHMHPHMFNGDLGADRTIRWWG